MLGREYHRWGQRLEQRGLNAITIAERRIRFARVLGLSAKEKHALEMGKKSTTQENDDQKHTS